MLSRTAIRGLRLRSPLPCPSPRSAIPAARNLHATVQQRLQKDAQDKDTLQPRSTEYSKSNSDDAAAATEEAAFDPNRTRPEDQVEKADEESGEDNNPLDVSPANRDISKPKHEEQSSVASSKSQAGEGSGGRSRSSGAGSAPKAGGGKHGGGY